MRKQKEGAIKPTKTENKQNEVRREQPVNKLLGAVSLLTAHSSFYSVTFPSINNSHFLLLRGEGVQIWGKYGRSSLEALPQKCENTLFLLNFEENSPTVRKYSCLNHWVYWHFLFFIKSHSTQDYLC